MKSGQKAVTDFLNLLADDKLDMPCVKISSRSEGQSRGFYDNFRITDELMGMIELELHHHKFYNERKFSFTSGNSIKGPNGTNAYFMIYFDPNSRTMLKYKDGCLQLHRKTPYIGSPPYVQKLQGRQIEIYEENIRFSEDHIIAFFNR